MHSAPAHAGSFQWTIDNDSSSWSGQDIASLVRTNEGVLVSGKPAALFFVVTVPVEALRDISRVTMQLRALSLNPVATCVLMSRGQVVSVRDLALVSGRSWREYTFVFEDAKTAASPVDALAFGFAFTDTVEIRKITASGLSATELCLSEGYHANQVNGLFPFRMYGYSLNSAAYAIIAACGIFAGFRFLLARRKPDLYILLAAVPLFFFLIDAREVCEEFVIAKTHYVNYVSAPPAEQRYHWTFDLVGFSDFIRQHAPVGNEPVLFFGSDQRFGYVRYLVYPIRLERGGTSLGAVNALSSIDDYRLDNNVLRHKNGGAVQGGTGVKFNEHSFLYLLP